MANSVFLSLPKYQVFKISLERGPNMRILSEKECKNQSSHAKLQASRISNSQFLNFG